MGVIEASRALVALRFEVAVDEWDPDFITFVGIDSETDDLPVGQTRQHWAPDALAKKDEEIARCEALYREPAREAALRLVARFAHEKPQRALMIITRQIPKQRSSERRTVVRSTFEVISTRPTPGDARSRPPSLVLVSLGAARRFL